MHIKIISKSTYINGKTPPNEFGSMIARKDHKKTMQYHTRPHKVARGPAGSYKATFGLIISSL